MAAIQVIGLLLSLAILIFLAFRGWHILPAAIIASFVIIVTNQMNIWEGLESFADSTKNYFGLYLVMFGLGAIFGKLMGDSGAAKAIAVRLVKLLGKDRAVLIVVLASAILSYGGVSLFVCVFVLYPIGMVLFNHANITRRLFPACMLFGCGTFTMVATPGTPAITNVVPTRYLGTTVYAAPVLGIIASIIMFVLGYGYLMWTARKLQRAGEGFVIGPNDNPDSLSIENDKKGPSWIISLIPLIVVIGVIFGTRNILPSINSVNLGLTVGVLTCIVLMWPYLKERGVLTVINEGAAGGLVALLNTAVVVGFGGTVRAAPGFQPIVDFALGISLHPFVSASIAVNIVAGIAGSSSGGLTVFMETLGTQMLAKVEAAGFTADSFHRVAVIASSGLDSLPHSGPCVTTTTYCGLKQREAYPFQFVTNCVVTIIALVITVILAMFGVC